MNSFPDTPYELAMLLLSNLQELKFIQPSKLISGVVPEGWDLDKLEDALGEAYLYESCDSTERKVIFKYPALFFNYFKELLEHNEGVFCRHKPDRFYIVSEKHSYPDDPDTPEIQRYHQALKLAELLSKASDYAVPSDKPERLIFIDSGKIVLNLHFNASNLGPVDNLDKFEADFISSDMHFEQKKKIIVMVLCGMFKDRVQVEFGELLERFNELYDKIRHSYDLYVADFSYEKVKGEVVKEKVDSIIKINKVFSDIQNQLLAVPLAIVLVGGQLEKTGEFSIKNVLIWCGAFVFTVFMDLLVRNQKNTIQSVDAEVQQHEAQLKTKYQAIAVKFEEDFKQVRSRVMHQKRLLCVVDFIVAFSFLGITLITIWFNGWHDLLLENLSNVANSLLSLFS